ncbi:uncharacterized protein LOC133185164 [Saccostrea echinata]|uniref:uncharacterized protein LOC133185164 n=1 Tax=Saccostrea echinata TaxID=191078 RepID=UPI002A82D9E2|nr:uncharacterized protein LOC133185164 [Saccostrea echinata]
MLSKKHLKVSRKLISGLRQSLSEVEEILQSKEVLKSLSYEIRSDEFIKLPPKLNFKLPNFIPQNNQGQFSKLFGSLPPLSITTEEHGYTMKTLGSMSSPPFQQLLDVPKLITTIKTEYNKLYNVTCLSDVDLLVSGNNKIMKLYNLQGTLLNELKYICENRNLDICVSDYGSKAVVVVNQAGKLRFRYTGQSSTSKETFNPMGITTDSQAQILIADGNDHCIHILDQDGQFLNYIDNCDLYFPWGLCVDITDNLFVAEYGGKVKKIKYMD